MMKKKELQYGKVDDILAVDDLPEKDIEIPEWGCKVKIKAFDLAESLALFKDAADENGEFDTLKLTVLMLARGITEPKFSEKKAEQLAAKKYKTVDRIVKEINQLNGFGEDEKEMKKAFFSQGQGAA